MDCVLRSYLLLAFGFLICLFLFCLVVFVWFVYRNVLSVTPQSPTNTQRTAVV
ncbi:p6 [Carnation yellow fleck virus]|uniref:p6 n=1 Tax=Carnation yellow fleck virus TaxID=940280 RepID=UPI0003C9CFF2|nr:p6 [Carnation yellow fleck virus]ADV40939.1 p6 [Carnation yellow fleck virus]BBK15489.1 p6 [Carnation yellow fleck virus]